MIELLGLHRARAELLAERAAGFLRLAHHDVVDAERLERRDRQEPDRAAAGDEPARAGPGTAALGDAVQRDRERLDQRRVLEREVIGNPERVGGRDGLVAGKRALPVAVVGADPAPARAERDPPGEAVLALAALGRLAGNDPVADLPAGHPVADRGDRPRELVALDHARAPAPLDEEVQVGAADPAVADLEQELAGLGLRRGPVLDRDLELAHEDRRRHDVGNRVVAFPPDCAHADRLART